jgi:site-specific DNA-methyltransferase (adenine-specific)
MRTEHELRVGDASAMDAVADESIDLVVTSPPYPMIELWDGLFADGDGDVAAALEAGDGETAYELMHEQLDAVWDEVVRVLAPGGVACINVGDATRTVDGEFQLFPNHVRVTAAMRERGLSSLPDVLWRKPTNSLTKFMGSGTLPTNAYVTLEHEYVLVFRKGGTRSFPAGDEDRYESAFFWEERNRWFSDLWQFNGEGQSNVSTEARERSAAFPLELPLRLVRMYSAYGDTVLDPFAGTGTTLLAAMLSSRNAVGYELDSDLVAAFDDRLTDLPARSRRRVRERLDRHRSFVADRDDRPRHEAVHYDFPVVTKQEREIRLYAVDEVDAERIPPNGATADGSGGGRETEADGGAVRGSERVDGGDGSLDESAGRSAADPAEDAADQSAVGGGRRYVLTHAPI